MNKNLVNHQIVSMRKLAKIARSHLCQKIFRQINQIKKKIEKWENLENVDDKIKQKHLNELNKKLQTRLIEAKEFKSITPDTISKQSLIYDENYFNTLLKKSNTNISDRLIARICQNRQLQFNVKKFHLENPGCEQWLPKQIELWEQKRQKKLGKHRKNKMGIIKNKMDDEKNDQKHFSDKEVLLFSMEKELSPKTKNEKLSLSTPILKNKSSPSNKKSSSLKKINSYTPTFKITQMDENYNVDVKIDDDKIKTKSAIIKRIDLNQISSNNIIDDYNENNNEDEEKTENHHFSKKNQINDDFFLDKQNFNNSDIGQDFIQMRDMSDDDDFSNKLIRKNNSFNNDNRKKRKSLNNNVKHFDPTKQKSFTPNIKRRYFDVDENHSKSDQKLHPSWQAKLLSKEKTKISASNDKLNKHIKFS